MIIKLLKDHEEKHSPPAVKFEKY